MIHFTIQVLEDGWAVIEVELNNQKMEITFEYTPNDGLYELIYSALELSRKAESVIEFPHHPDMSTILIIEPFEDDQVRIKLSDIIDYVSIVQYYRAILRMFDKYLYEHSKEEYETTWRRSFPENEWKYLRALYRASK